MKKRVLPLLVGVFVAIPTLAARAATPCRLRPTWARLSRYGRRLLLTQVERRPPAAPSASSTTDRRSAVTFLVAGLGWAPAKCSPTQRSTMRLRLQARTPSRRVGLEMRITWREVRTPTRKPCFLGPPRVLAPTIPPLRLSVLANGMAGIHTATLTP